MFVCANTNVKSIIIVIVIKMNLKIVSPRHVEFIHRNRIFIAHKSLQEFGPEWPQ